MRHMERCRRARQDILNVGRVAGMRRSSTTKSLKMSVTMTVSVTMSMSVISTTTRRLTATGSARHSAERSQELTHDACGLLTPPGICLRVAANGKKLGVRHRSVVCR